MTASSQTASSNKKGTAAVLAAGFAAAFAPIVIAMMMAPPAEAYSSTYCTYTGTVFGARPTDEAQELAGCLRPWG